MMRIKNTLLNPFALVAQGFLAGAVLFFATAPRDSDRSDVAPPLQSAAIAEIPGA